MALFMRDTAVAVYIQADIAKLLADVLVGCVCHGQHRARCELFLPCVGGVSDCQPASKQEG